MTLGEAYRRAGNIGHTCPSENFAPCRRCFLRRWVMSLAKRKNGYDYTQIAPNDLADAVTVMEGFTNLPWEHELNSYDEVK